MAHDFCFMFVADPRWTELAVDNLLFGNGISAATVLKANTSTLMLRFDFNQDYASPVTLIAPPSPVEG